jgi:CheY-like chemotaxis protein
MLTVSGPGLNFSFPCIPRGKRLLEKVTEFSAQHPRLLLVEDNPDTRQIYKNVFEREGFRVLLAEDGEKGLSFAQSTLPDVILLDWMLPKLSGFDFLKRLRALEDTRAIPVAIFSAVADPSDKKKAADLGVTEYAVKTVNPPKQVVNRIRALLAREGRLAGQAPPADSYSVALLGSSHDAARLAAQAGLAEGFRCPDCQAEVLLVMLTDTTRTPGLWFAAHVVCSGCRRDF